MSLNKEEIEKILSEIKSGNPVSQETCSLIVKLVEISLKDSILVLIDKDGNLYCKKEHEIKSGEVLFDPYGENYKVP